MKWERSIYTTDNRKKKIRTIFKYLAKSKSDKFNNRMWMIVNDYHHKGSGSHLLVQHHPASRYQDLGQFSNLKTAKAMAESIDQQLVNV